MIQYETVYNGVFIFFHSTTKANLDSVHTSTSTFTRALFVGGHGETLKVSQQKKRKAKERILQSQCWTPISLE